MENTGRTLSDINQSKILYDPPPTVMEIKTKVNKWDLIKVKSFCTTKEIISKVKRQPSEWEKIIAKETTDKGLISKIYKQLTQFNTRKTNNPVKKWEKDLNCMSVQYCWSPCRMIEPPLPPSPPSGPPKATNFSRRKCAEPAPPCPERAKIFT